MHWTPWYQLTMPFLHSRMKADEQVVREGRGRNEPSTVVIKLPLTTTKAIHQWYQSEWNVPTSHIHDPFQVSMMDQKLTLLVVGCWNDEKVVIFWKIH